MDEHVARLALRVGDGKTHALSGHDAGVADLPARLAVERRLVEDDGAALAGAQRIDLVAVLHQRGNDPFGALGLVAEELGRADALLDGKPERLGLRFPRSGPGGARLFALALHRRAEGVSVAGDAAWLERILRQAA